MPTRQTEGRVFYRDRLLSSFLFSEVICGVSPLFHPHVCKSMSWERSPFTEMNSRLFSMETLFLLPLTVTVHFWLFLLFALWKVLISNYTRHIHIHTTTKWQSYILYLQQGNIEFNWYQKLVSAYFGLRSIFIFFTSGQSNNGENYFWCCRFYIFII